MGQTANFEKNHSSIITQVWALALNFKSKNISEMDPSLPVLDFVGSVHIAPKSLGPVRHGANRKL